MFQYLVHVHAKPYELMTSTAYSGFRKKKILTLIRVFFRLDSDMALTFTGLHFPQFVLHSVPVNLLCSPPQRVMSDFTKTNTKK